MHYVVIVSRLVCVYKLICLSALLGLTVFDIFLKARTCTVEETVLSPDFFLSV